MVTDCVSRDGNGKLLCYRMKMVNCCVRGVETVNYCVLLMLMKIDLKVNVNYLTM